MGNRIVDVKNFDWVWFYNLPEQKRRRGNQSRKSKDRYIDCISAFDIETSTIPGLDQNVIYIWQWCFDGQFTIIGRTWEEFNTFKNQLVMFLQQRELSLVVYVFNLSYEFQFLRGIYPFKEDEVFCIDPRRILKCSMHEDTIQFRCAYMLTNQSLKGFLRDMKVEHQKLDDYDYDAVRYSWTPLTDRELEYCVNDVLGLVEALKKSMAFDNDNLYTVPFTATGYVRRDAKKALRSQKWNIELINEMRLSPDLYLCLREAFRGGNTHANRYFVDQKLDNVKSMDRCSSYPAVLLTKKYPMSKFIKVDNPSGSDLSTLLNKNKAIIMRVIFTKVNLKDYYDGCPYLAVSKCKHMTEYVDDNGRVLEADLMETCLTDIDFGIILDHYDFESMNILELWYADYKPLPDVFKDVIKQYYNDKTTMKGIPELEIAYTRAKAKLNSLYGMSAQDPVKQSILFRNDDYVEDDKTIEQLLEENDKHAFLSYSWGVWVTAWARWELQRAIDRASFNFVYCDTDSVKYVCDVDFSDLNKELQQEAEQWGAVAKDKKGKSHYMGVWENDGEYDCFKTLGAKKYVYETDGQLHVTVAGVQKGLRDAEGHFVTADGGQELMRKGGIDAFEEGFIFSEAGGTELCYHDHPSEELENDTITIDGHEQKITSNVVIKKGIYTLGITAEYERLLQRIKYMVALPPEI